MTSANATPRRGSTERWGVGQSGYTAGRTRDPALEHDLQTRNATYRHLDEDEALRSELDTDDRFTGRGGPLVSDPDEPPRTERSRK
jgi:hypothetical protein